MIFLYLHKNFGFFAYFACNVLNLLLNSAIIPSKLEVFYHVAKMLFAYPKRLGKGAFPLTYKFIKFGGSMLAAAFAAAFLPPEISAAAGIVLLVAGAVFSFAFKRFNLLKLCTFGAAAGAVLVSAYLFVNFYPAQALCGTSAYISGTVTEVCGTTGRPAYVVKTDGISLSGAPQKVTLRLYGFSENGAKPFDKIKCKVSFCENYAENRAGFLTDRSSGISLYAYMSTAPKITGREENSLRYYIYLLRSKIENTIDEYFSGWQGAFTKRLLIGLRGGLSTEITDSFRIAGISHILAVSGMHLSVIVGTAEQFFRVVFGKKSKKRIFVLPIMVLTLVYMAAAGFGVSVRRAGLMLLASCFARLLSTESASFDNLGIATVLVLITDPMACCDAGFLLSAASSGAIIAFSPALYGFFARIFESCEKSRLLAAAVSGFSASIPAWLATIPISLAAFGEISFAAPIASICSMPFAKYAIIFSMLAVLLGFVPFFNIFANGCAVIAGAMESAVLAIAKFFAGIPLFRVRSGGEWIIIWAAGAAVLILLPILVKRNFSYIRYSAVTAVFVLLAGILCQSVLCSGTASIDVIPTSEGSAVLCSKGGSSVLITENLVYKDIYRLYGKVSSPDVLVSLDSSDEAAELCLCRRIKPKLALLSNSDAVERYYGARLLRGGSLSFWDKALLCPVCNGVFTLDTGEGTLLYISENVDTMRIAPLFRRAEIIVFNGSYPSSFPSLRCKCAVTVFDGIIKSEEIFGDFYGSEEAGFRLRNGNVAKAI